MNIIVASNHWVARGHVTIDLDEDMRDWVVITTYDEAQRLARGRRYDPEVDRIAVCLPHEGSRSLGAAIDMMRSRGWPIDASPPPSAFGRPPRPPVTGPPRLLGFDGDRLFRR